jgi:hypothetical protein
VQEATGWTKLGRIYDAPPLHEKLLSHAANPLAVPLDGDVFRVFFSGRDAQNRSSVGHFDVDLASRSVLRVCSQPDFVHGPENSFHSHGVSIGNCYVAGGTRYMLFMGWHIPPGEHWRGEIGRLVVGPDLTLSLEREAPFIPLSASDPVSLSYPWVIGDEQTDFRMWYGSTREWDAGNGEMLHVIRQARSEDGHHWRSDGPDLPAPLGIAQAFSRPTLVDDAPGRGRMWFSYRSGSGQAYRIGEAAAGEADGEWSLLPGPQGIDVSSEGWDSEMIEYPFVFARRGRLYMLYNGNGFGRSGIGLAVAEGEAD